MKKIKVEIQGIAPILFNRFTEEAMVQLDKGTSGKKKTKQGKIQEAMTKVYRDGNGIMCIPKDNIKKCFLNGCRMAKLKVGRSSAEPYMRATVFLDEDSVPVLTSKRKPYKEPDGIHECTGNIPPGPKGHKAIIRRPFCERGWICAFSLLLFDERTDTDLVQQALNEGGKLVGLCDHRPEYGRFTILKFEEVAD